MTSPIDQYNAWRITFQSAERATQSAYAEMLRYRKALERIHLNSNDADLVAYVADKALKGDPP